MKSPCRDITIYPTRISSHTSRRLGLKLSEIDRSVLQTYVDQKHQNGRKDGKGGLSPRSLRLHKNILYQTLNMAVRDGMIPNNPCDFLILPQTEHYESHFYSGAQLAELLDAVRDENLFPVIKLTAVYGLRRSEVLGLKWDSVDFDAGTITVKHTVAKVTQIVEKDKTKNKTSRRTFPLTPDVREMLFGFEASGRRKPPPILLPIYRKTTTS